jgi:hypothetical protein
MSRLLIILGAAAHVACFGTIDLGDQEFEHERITRNALACPAGTAASPPYDCFEPKSIDALAGDGGLNTGAIGAPDADEVLDSAAHCDNADFLDLAALGLQGTYARSREQATSTLFECIDHLRGRIDQGVVAAAEILNGDGLVDRSETDIDDITCIFVGSVQGRAKCNTIEGFGRALHGVQDFFAHSNWVDVADGARPVSVANPPGLNRSATDRPPFLKLTDGSLSAGSAEIPRDLATGCFISSVSDPFGGADECEKAGRITHEALNKDNGAIEVVPLVEVSPASNVTGVSRTSRGLVGANFERAVDAAIEESRRQWDDFRDALKLKYGEEKGLRMIRALVMDIPWEGDAEKKSAGHALGCSFTCKLMMGMLGLILV